MSGSDMVAVIAYGTARPVATVLVGDHPQRLRLGAVSNRLLPRWHS